MLLWIWTKRIIKIMFVFIIIDNAHLQNGHHWSVIFSVLIVLQFYERSFLKDEKF